MVHSKDCLLSDTKESLASFETQPALGLRCVFGGMLLDSLIIPITAAFFYCSKDTLLDVCKYQLGPNEQNCLHVNEI